MTLHLCCWPAAATGDVLYVMSKQGGYTWQAPSLLFTPANAMHAAAPHAYRKNPDACLMMWRVSSLL